MNSRYLAGLSLAVMACGFILTLFLPESVGAFLLKGGFEAGLVGGIADWFAVTALFRHPLGIPIPHTSLLIKNKDRIVQSLVSAMENELLNKQSIESKLKKWNVLHAVASMLTRWIGKKQVRVSILELCMGLVRRISVDKIVPFLQSGIISFVRRADLKSVADTVVTKAVNEGYDAKALDYVLHEASKWAVRSDTQRMLGRMANEKLAEVKTSGFMGFAIQAFAGFMDEEKMGGMLQNMLLSAIRDLQLEHNVHRDTLLREIRVQLFQFADNESRLEQLKEWAASLVEGESGELFLRDRLEDIRSLVLDKLEGEMQTGGRSIFAAYRSLVRTLSKDQGMVEAWENRISDYIVQLVETNHYRIGQLVKENVDQMDDASLVSMLEEKVGKDLQWIRVNGAFCGFLVGILLSLIQL